jgi:hypothetical protein
MRKRDRALDKILEAFAESAAAHEVKKAEGWLAVAVWLEGISENAILVPVR